MANRLWVLGATDPEMAAIERLLHEAGEQVAYAVGPDGERVHPGNACRAVGFRLSTESDGLYTRWDGECYIVECGGDLPPDALSIDHHWPGDPGYGRPPEEFLQASSIGQVLALLGGTPGYCSQGSAPLGPVAPGEYRLVDGRWVLVTGTHTEQDVGGYDVLVSTYQHVNTSIVLTAAADHCLEAAYRGRCPGVDPDALMRWRAESRAAFQGRAVADVVADVEAARQRLRAAVTHPADIESCPRWSDGTPMASEYADLRGESIPELPEAAARECIPFIAEQTGRDGRRKVVLMAAPPKLVSRFMAGEVVPGLVDYYGDPMRGLAGGYHE